MRILHAISGIDPSNGGPTNALVGLTAAQVRAGLQARVISTWQFRDAFRSEERLRSFGVGVRMVGQAFGKLSRHPDLAATLSEELKQTDILHVHAVWEEMQYQACKAARRLNVPYVFTPHGMLDPWNMRKSRLAKAMFLALRMRANINHAALLHFTTEIERDWVARFHLKPPAIVENLGIDLKEFETLPPRGQFRSRWPQLGDAPIVLFLGRVHFGKGLELLVPALAKMRRRDAMLVIAGPDESGYGAHIRQVVGQHDLTARVIFTGMVAGQDKLAALVDAALLAAPSYHENFGLAVIEALAAGTPVIVSDQVNLHPQIKAAGVGAVVPMNVPALAGELDRWLDDSSLRAAASAAAPPLVRGKYDWQAIAQRWVGHYGRIAK